jgi:hypothetical protein
MKLKATPPKPAVPPADDKVAAFIGGATAASPAPSPAPQSAPRNPVSAPWKAERVRGDMLVQVNVRLPEPLALKLKHVSHMTDRQRQDLVAEALEPLLNAKLLELGYGKEDL